MLAGLRHRWVSTGWYSNKLMFLQGDKQINVLHLMSNLQEETKYSWFFHRWFAKFMVSSLNSKNGRILNGVWWNQFRQTMRSQTSDSVVRLIESVVPRCFSGRIQTSRTASECGLSGQTSRTRQVRSHLCWEPPTFDRIPQHGGENQVWTAS